MRFSTMRWLDRLLRKVLCLSESKYDAIERREDEFRSLYLQALIKNIGEEHDRAWAPGNTEPMVPIDVIKARATLEAAQQMKP